MLNLIGKGPIAPVPGPAITPLSPAPVQDQPATTVPPETPMPALAEPATQPALPMDPVTPASPAAESAGSVTTARTAPPQRPAAPPALSVLPSRIAAEAAALPPEPELETSLAEARQAALAAQSQWRREAIVERLATPPVPPVPLLDSKAEETDSAKGKVAASATLDILR